MKVSKIKYMYFMVFFLLISSIFIGVANGKNEKINNTVIIPMGTVDVSIESDKEPLSDGSYVVGSQLTFKVKDDSYSEMNLTLTGSERAFTIDLNPGEKEWTNKWDTNEPLPNDDPVTPDTYKLSIEIDGDEKTCDPAQIVISAEPVEGDLLLIILVIVAIVAGVGITSLIVIKKKRGAKAESLEFDDVEKMKQKKKGKVFKGASAIGKQSGQLAETKPKPIAKSSEKTKSSKDKALELLGGPSTPSQAKPTTTSKKQMMPVSSEFQFETKSSSSAAMLKDMELKMDLGQKIDFLTSNVESHLQNIEFFKSILEQHEQTVLECPKCKKIMSRFWSECPYCKIEAHNSELGLKESLLIMSSGVKFCPDCNRVVKENWLECPFCYVKNK